jgi:hypothetical protein
MKSGKTLLAVATVAITLLAGCSSKPSAPGTNTVGWTLPTQAELNVTVGPNAVVSGVQIMRLDCDKDNVCTQTVAGSRSGTYQTLRTGSFTDTNGTADSLYRVDMVFAGNSTQDPNQGLDRFSKPAAATPPASQVPWVIGTLLLAVVLAAAVSVFILASRTRAARLQANFVEEEPPAGVDSQTGLPAHDVKCPTCSTAFQAVGNMPLQITCPNCGATGTLQ